MSDDDERSNPKAHKKLLQAIGSLNKVQHIKQPTRNEPQQQQNEFQLDKGGFVAHDRPAANPVGIKDILQILKTKKKHHDVGKQMKNVQSTKKVLHKPLEKTAAERIKRIIGYETIQKKLERWDAVVAKNRSAETQIFPLPTESIYINTAANAKPLQLSIKSKLAEELEANESKLKALKRARYGFDDDEDLLEREKMELQKKLTKDELFAKRRELAYLKMRESQKSAKARMKNKIKSKKYHKLQKRQMMLEQIKEFELLQKTNPEAALEKLNELEKNRVLERASLRHKNTGTWAKNLQVRAKYDKDVRKDLAEQLEVSRKLTEKKKDYDSADDDIDDEVETNNRKELILQDPDYDPFNPWTRVGRESTNASKTDDIDGENNENWRKYWSERNLSDKLLDAYNSQMNEACNVNDEPAGEVMEVSNVDKMKDIKAAKILKKIDKPKNKNKSVVKSVLKKSKKKVIENGWLVEELISPKAASTAKPNTAKPKTAEPSTAKPKKPKVKTVNPNTPNIDDIFDAQEDKIRNKLSKKLRELSKQAERYKQNRTTLYESKRNEQDALKNLKDLTFKNEIQRPEIDEELINENDGAKSNIVKHNGLETAASSINNSSEENPKQTPNISDKIDPNILAPVILKQKYFGAYNGISEATDDVAIDEDEFDEAAEKQMTISEAFEDDDIIADFSTDKTKDSELKNAEIQLFMPGWGSWAGAGISEEQTNRRANKNKRLVLKLAQEEKRRDDNKDGVYINEEGSKQLRAHLVSEVPFPFKSLQDYEASIRAPVGRNFVPETAFRMLTRPSIITRKGAVIEPMDEDELIKPERNLRHIVDRRIQRAAAAAGKKTK